MAAFPMCDDCLAEYEDPGHRRFHAQPNACPVCGPSLTLLDCRGGLVAGEPVDAAVALLKEGRILAVKGLGGYHLAVDPCNEEAVRELRGRKRRDEDLKNVATLRSLEETVRHLERILRIEPELVAYDLHPDFLSTAFALGIV